MDQMRLLLALVLSFLVFMLWNVFFNQEPKQKPVPQLQQEASKEAREPVPSEAPPMASKTLEHGAIPAAKPERPAKKITVETPLYKAVLSEKGGAITHFILKKYHVSAQTGSPLMNLLPENGAIDGLQIGLAGMESEIFEQGFFEASLHGDQLNLSDGSRELTFRLVAENGIGLEKIYKFKADSYVIGLEVQIKNGSGKPVKDSLWVALRNAIQTKKNSSAFEGPSALVNRSLENIPIDEISKKNTLTGNIKWAALESRYFMTALIPLSPQDASLRLSAGQGGVVEARYIEPERTLDAGGRQQIDFNLFFGPKIMQQVAQAGHELERIIDFGYFDIFAKPCLWLMNYLFGIIPNYGVAIIILTILSKILLWPLGTKSYKSMSQMKKLQPLLQEIRDKYKNDRKKMNEEVMRLHRTYGINPLGGCLPMVVQIPVFFALYRMLDQAIELRHAPFFGWINDLSVPDRLGNFDFAIPFMEPPYGIPVLTLIMGATMLWQQKMTPSVGDPTQAKMMMLMPVVFTFIFINFSAGLVLYWLVNNILSIGQQYYTQKKFG
jgi:YidC/Oxa1 family membrane protein insertase